MSDEQYWDCDKGGERYPFNTGNYTPAEVETTDGEVLQFCGGCAVRGVFVTNEATVEKIHEANRVRVYRELNEDQHAYVYVTVRDGDMKTWTSRQAAIRFADES